MKISLSAPLSSRWQRRLLAALLLPAALLAHAQEAPQGQPQTDLPRMEMSVNMHLIHAQIASTPQQRQIGLMYRTSMPVHEGMLFAFERPGIQCFWMKNTRLPLTAAFIADDGRIVNLARMQPESTEQHCSQEPVRYVLEMNQGWFSKRNIKAGDLVHGTVFAAPASPSSASRPAPKPAQQPHPDSSPAPKPAH